MILLIPLAIAAIACWWVIANAANPFPTNARPASVPTTGRGVPAQCTGHYYRKTFADRWVCAECGHTVEVTTADDMNAIEAWANGEAL